MKIAFYLNVISPHQLPLAREIVRLVGEENFRYVYVEDFLADRKAMGWNDGDVPVWCMKGDKNVPELINADLVYTGLRCVDLMARRSAIGKKTVYFSERWFKPRLGVFRLLSPSYRCMAREFVRLIDDGGVVYLSCGIHSACDMARLCGLMHGDLSCLFRAPELEFEREPGGMVFLTQRHRGTEVDARETKKYCLDKMRMWGYFVESGKRGTGNREQKTNDKRLRVLWVGRLLKLKRVDTIIRAVGELSRCSIWLNITLDIYGVGPEESCLKKIAAKYGDIIKFCSPVSIDKVRNLMREHEVYVFGSNGYEGWGAVVSEALEEGMSVLGTCEAGASATMLPKERQFHAGDWRGLMRLLEKERDGLLPSCTIGDWTAEVAASRLLEFA